MTHSGQLFPGALPSGRMDEISCNTENTDEKNIRRFMNEEYSHHI